MLEIKKTTLSIGDTLGEGSFGTVFKATWTTKKHLRNVAIKIIDVRTMNKNNVYEEALLLSRCNHMHIVKCYGFVEDFMLRRSTGNGIVMEYISSGDLRSYVEENEYWFRKQRNKWFLLKMVYQIGLAMSFLEDIGVVHRDLAARNILVEEIANNEPLVKVSDFGLARHQSRYYINYNSPIPFKWSAPEVLDRGIYTHKSDVWAYGVTMWEIYSFGSMPYEDMTNRDVRTFEDIVQKFENYFDRRPYRIQRFYYD